MKNRTIRDLFDQAESVRPRSLSLPLPKAKEEEAKVVSAILVEAAATMDLLEPFSRMVKALAALGEEHGEP